MGINHHFFPPIIYPLAPPRSVLPFWLSRVPQHHRYYFTTIVVHSLSSFRSNFQGRVRRKFRSGNVLRHRGRCSHKSSVIEAFVLFDRAIQEGAQSRGGKKHLVSLPFYQSIAELEKTNVGRETVQPVNIKTRRRGHIPVGDALGSSLSGSTTPVTISLDSSIFLPFPGCRSNGRGLSLP